MTTVDPATTDACYGIICDVCCWNGNCITDEIVCQVEADSDFNTILILIYVIVGLLIGIPLALFIADILMLRKPFGCSMSVCEFFANYVCSICCLNKRYREKLSKEGKDTFTLLNLPKTAAKKLKNTMSKEKVTPENLGALQNIMPDP